MDESKVDPLPTRLSLLSRVKNLDDARSWEEFIRTYGRLVQGLARSRGLTMHEAEDVAQEVFQNIARTIQQFRPAPHAGAFRSWLGRLTKWRVEDRRRARDRFASPARATDEPRTATIERVPAPDDVNEEFEQQARRHLLATLFQQLESRVPPKQLQIFQLVVMDDLPAARVAQMYGMTVTHVYVIRHRVMQKLREEVEKLPLEW